MVTSAREFFADQAAHPDVPSLAGVHGTYDFAINDRDHWYLSVDDGHVSVSQNPDPGLKPDCTLVCTEDDFVGFVNGERNMITYAMRGRVKLSGNLALAQTLNAYVRSHGLRQSQQGGQP